MNNIISASRSFMILILATIIGVSSISAAKKKVESISIPLPTEAKADEMFSRLDYGLRVQVISNVDEQRIIDISEMNSKEAKDFPEIRFSNTLSDAADEYLGGLTRQLGFRRMSGSENNYILRVKINDFKVRIPEYNVKKKIARSSATMVISWELLDPDREVIISSTTNTGRATGNSFNDGSFLQAIYTSYGKALNGIDWESIARELKVAKTAREEQHKQVTGEGNTALEHTIIRWYITSSPLGADVYWRVVSSTPDVANTMANFIGTTPYESTEAFDIKGLTYQNSGNVQIEVSCERPGYLTQKKRFNLRQVIDQKEISAKLNLVKEVTESEPKTDAE